jgi:hypothetical protein
LASSSILEGPAFRAWWRSLSDEDRRQLRRATGSAVAQADPQRAAVAVSIARYYLRPMWAILNLTLVAVIGLLWDVFLRAEAPKMLPSGLFTEAVFLLVMILWLAFRQRRLRAAERCNLAVVEGTRGAREPTREAASWEVLGPEPRTYRLDRAFYAFLLFAWGVQVSALLIVAAWIPWSPLKPLLIGLALLLSRGEVRFGLFGLSRITISPEGIDVLWRRGRIRRVTWDDVRRVRQLWRGNGLVRTLLLEFADGKRVTLLDKRFVGFDELRALVLRSVPEDRIDRRPLAGLWHRRLGVSVPPREREDQPIPSIRPGDRAPLFLALGLLGVSFAIDLVALTRVLFPTS